MSAHVSSFARPDGRVLVRPAGAWTADEAAAAVALAGRLGRRALAHVKADASGERDVLLEAGFTESRREALVQVAIDPALAALRGRTLPAGVVVRSAGDVDERRLRVLDDELRQDVPGTDGWRSSPAEFRAQTFEDPAFDPRAYLVAVDGDSDEYLGLVRIWMNPAGPRLGLVGVRRAHRRRGIASGVLAPALAAVRSTGAQQVSSSFDVANRGSAALLGRLGGRRVGTVVELVLEPARARGGPGA